MAKRLSQVLNQEAPGLNLDTDLLFLSPREEKAFKIVYTGGTLLDVAKNFGISKGRAGQIVAKTRLKVKNRYGL